MALTLLLTPAGARAIDLTANTDLTGGAVLTGSPDSIVRQADGKTYWWADKNGNGTMVPASAGLNLGSFNLTRGGDAVGFVLNLNNGTTDGAIAWGGSAGGKISAARSGGGDDGGPITIRGATDIACSEINTSGSGTCPTGAGDISIVQSGNLSASKILASGNYSGTGGRISLMGAGGLSNVPSGQLNISYSIENWLNAARTVVLAGYDSVRVGSGGIKTYQPASGNPNGVTITNIGPGGVEVTGPIQTYSLRENGTGHVIVDTAGAAKLGNVDTHRGEGGNWVYQDAGNVIVRAGGNIEVTGSLLTYMLGSGVYSANAGNVTIASTGGWVRLNHIVTTNQQNLSNRYAGDLTVTSYGDLTIKGTIDLGSPNGGDRRGDLTLTTGADGGITLSNLNVAAVNVAKVIGGGGAQHDPRGIDELQHEQHRRDRPVERSVRDDPDATARPGRQAPLLPLRTGCAERRAPGLLLSCGRLGGNPRRGRRTDARGAAGHGGVVQIGGGQDARTGANRTTDGLWAGDGGGSGAGGGGRDGGDPQ